MLTEKAFAKINLTLEITGKREDGYHLLETVMQEISLSDTVSVREIPSGIHVVCSDGKLSGKENIAFRTAELFLKRTGITRGAEIFIEKRIPLQAGLGGGSADAAAVLRLLNDLFRTGLSREELCLLGAQTGADVPFCIGGSAQLCEGIGEKLSPAPPLPPCEIVVVKPDFSVSTAQAYREIDRRGLVCTGASRKMCEALGTGDIREIAGRLRSHFDLAADSPEIGRIRQRMKEYGALGAMMTGSGSAVFALFPQEDPAAHACRDTFGEEGYAAYVCRPVSRAAGSDLSE